MIDTHAHLEASFGDLSEIKGLKAVVLSGPSLETSKVNLELAKKFPQFYPAAGIHPQEINDDINLLEELVKDPKVVAVGECGLEFIGEVDVKRQEEYFRKQIELAQKYQKPLIVHARKAVDEVIQILSKYENLRGVIHCYTGGKKRVQKVINLGKDWYFGIDGNVTYEEGLAEVVATIPHNRLLAETDSPELTPLPFRGEKNHPKYVKYVYQKVAEIWGMGFEETEKIIDGNAERLFHVIGNNIL
jgi:TatD DNase family protein